MSPWHRTRLALVTVAPPRQFDRWRKNTVNQILMQFRSFARTFAAMLCVAGAPAAMEAQKSPAVPGARMTAPYAFDQSGSRPFSAISDATLAARDSLVALARRQVGRRYVLGGTNPGGGFDCSGLVRYVASALRIPLPRTAAEQARAGMKVAPDSGVLRPGDVLTFGRGRISHVGIYVGSGRMVHASSRAGRVIETRVDPRRSQLPLRGARRVVATAETVERSWFTP